MVELAHVAGSISMPVGTAFHYVTNMENYGHWFPGVTAIKAANHLGQTVVGKKYVETLTLPNGLSELNIEVVKCEIDRLFVTKGDLAEILPQMTIRFFSEASSNCHIDLTYHSRNPALTETSEIVMALREDLGRRAETGLTRLRGILESGDYK